MPTLSQNTTTQKGHIMDIMSKISNALIVLAILIALTIGDTPIFWMVMGATAVTLTIETVQIVQKWRKHAA